MAWLRDHVEVDASAEAIARHLIVSCCNCTVAGSAGPSGDEVLHLRPPFDRFDLLSVRGVAREVAALVDGARLMDHPLAAPPTGVAAVEVAVGDRGFNRIVAVRLRIADAADAPAILAERLHLAGIKTRSPLHNVAAYAVLDARRSDPCGGAQGWH